MKKKIIHQILAVTPVLLIKFMIGFGDGWISSIGLGLYTFIGRGLSSLLIVLVIDRFGRNTILMLSALLSFMMWIMVYISRSFYVHCTGTVQLAFGISVGFCEAAPSIYITENFSSKMRAIFSGLGCTFFYLGQLVGFVLLEIFSDKANAINGIILGFIVILSTFLLKEPAQCLIMKSNLTKAEKNYDYLHNLQKTKTSLEFEDMKQYIDGVKNRKFSLALFRTKVVSKSRRLLVISFLSSTSKCAFMGYFTPYFGYPGLPIWMTLLQVVCFFLLSPFMDTFNRRTLFFVCSVLMAITHAAVFAFRFVSPTLGIVYYHYSEGLLYIIITTFLCVDGMFMGFLIPLVLGELLPQDIKALGSSLAVVSGPLGYFFLNTVFLIISKTFENYNSNIVSFIVLFLPLIAVFLYIYIDLPETKGKTLVEIQRELIGDEEPKEIVLNTLENARNIE